MDNLTHSLVGALFGQMGLKSKTGLAMPTLITAANLSDIDAVAVLLGGHQHLAIRRGITHGPIAMVVLPLLLWGAMLWFDRWQTRRGTKPEKRLPVNKGWLLVLAFIGCLSHPLFDWFNSYGVRLLEPFSSQWFYGDTIFIIDIWLWIALIAGIWISLRRERKGIKRWRVPAVASFAAVCAYILANGLITGRAERLTAEAVQRQHGIIPTLVVANPVPVQFWKREMLWRDESLYGRGYYSLFDRPDVRSKMLRHNMSDTSVAISAQADPDVGAVVFWSRMPVASIQDKMPESELTLTDQRFMNSLARGNFIVKSRLRYSAE